MRFFQLDSYFSHTALAYSLQLYTNSIRPFKIDLFEMKLVLAKILSNLQMAVVDGELERQCSNIY